jgi:hypothetical protein
MARELLPMSRLSFCGRLQLPKKNVEIWHSPTRSQAFYKNLVTCGCVWTCPVCASKISERRKQELAAGLKTRPDLFTAMDTLTVQHSRADTLRDLRFRFENSLKLLRSGKEWKLLKDKYGFVGDIFSTEITWTKENGWHLHKHGLVLSSNPVDPVERKVEIFRLYERALKKYGLYADFEHGLNVSIPKNEINELYPVKWGLEEELTKSNVKKAHKGYSPYQLLDLLALGPGLDEDFYGLSYNLAGALFREYAAATKGVHQLQYSKGLRKILDMGPVKTDDELAIETVEHGDILLATLTVKDWALVLANNAEAEVLDAADAGDLHELIKFLRGIGALEWLTKPFMGQTERE